MSLQQRIPSHQCLRDFNYQMSSASDESNLAAENSTQDDDFQNLRVDIRPATLNNLKDVLAQNVTAIHIISHGDSEGNLEF